MVRVVTAAGDTRRRFLRATLVAALGLALGACGQADDDSSAAAGAAPVDHHVEPARPPAMGGSDVVAAQATIEYALALIPYAFTTGDLTAWRALSHEDCKFCQKVVDDVRELHRDDGYREGGAYRIHKVEVFDPTPGHDYFAVDLTIERAPTREIDPSGEVLVEQPTTYALTFTAVALTDGEWQVREITMNEVDKP